jgi:hypothetical protein
MENQSVSLEPQLGVRLAESGVPEVAVAAAEISIPEPNPVTAWVLWHERTELSEVKVTVASAVPAVFLKTTMPGEPDEPICVQFVGGVGMVAAAPNRMQRTRTLAVLSPAGIETTCEVDAVVVSLVAETTVKAMAYGLSAGR